jgi:hypothetical protein
MAEDQQLSPEEKLLKVIQAPEGQKEKPAQPPRTQPSAATAASADPPQKPTPAKKLKPESAAPQPAPVATTPLPPGGAKVASQAPEVPQAVSGSLHPSEAAEPAGAALSGSSGDGSWFRHTNRVLGVITFLMILLVAYECWSNLVAVREREKPGPDEPRILPAPAAAELPPLDGLIAEFEKGIVIQHPEDGVGSAARTNSVGPVTLTGWRDYAQRNLDLIGMASSGGPGAREAIVVDREKKQMHIVKPGDKLIVDGRQIEVVSVGEDEIDLTDGSVKLAIK